MKKYLVLMIILLTASSAWASGTWSANNFSYKPQLTTQGTTDYANFNTSQDRVDAKLAQIVSVGDPAYPTFAAAIATLNAAGTECVLRLPAGATYAITANTTINGNIALLPDNGAVITVATGKTLTINGPFDAGVYQVFSCTGTGKVVFGRPSGVKELAPQWWGATSDGSTDDIIPLQAMVDCSVASGGLPMFLPGGTYKITDTLKLNKGVAYAGFTFRGAGSSVVSGFNTVIDATAFGDRPAINVQGARQINLEDFIILGKNVAPVTIIQAWQAAPSTSLDPNVANWITAGCVDSRHSPYAGISFDAYYGTAPADPYPNDPYGRTVSSGGVVLNRVKVQGFVVGLMLAPWAVADQDCASISVYDSEIRYNTFGYSCGSSQARSIQFYNTNVYSNWCCFTTIRHGNLNGNCPSLFGGILQLSFKLFELGAANSNNDKIVSGVHCEVFGYLGEFGAADSRGAVGTAFVGCRFTWGQCYEPYFFIANSPLHFDSCSIDGYGIKQVLNYWSSHTVRFTSCGFRGFLDTINGFIGISSFGADTIIQTNEFSSCEVEGIAYTDSGQNLSVNNDFKYSSASRNFIAPWTHTVRLWGAKGFTNYKVSLPYYGYRSGSLGISGVSITGTDHNAVLAFTAANATDWKVGDVILWQVPDRTGTWTGIKVPAFKVTGAVGTAITATSLIDNVDVAYAPTTVSICLPLFFNATESTGNTHSNTTIDNVNNIANWKIGDWIQGAGIDTDTRIVNIVGTTITLSKAATASAIGTPLYNCRLTPTNGQVALPTPVVPATTVEQGNANAFPVKVTVTGGTVTAFAIGPTGATVATGATTGAFVLQPGWCIKMTYSVAPTWVWNTAY